MGGGRRDQDGRVLNILISWCRGRGVRGQERRGRMKILVMKNSTKC